MNLKEIYAKAGSIFNYSGYIVLLFVWSMLNYSLTMFVPESSGTVYTIISWGMRLLVGPLVYAVFYSGVFEQQMQFDELEKRSFFSQLKMHGLRFMGANLFYLIFFYLVLMIIFLISGINAMQFADNHLLSALLSGLSSMLMLFWFSGLVIEARLQRSLLHAIKLLLTNPVALIIGLVWLAFCVADSLAFDFNDQPASLVLNLARSAILAVLKTFLVTYILVIYQATWGRLIQRIKAMEILVDAPTYHPGDGLAKASLGFGLFSFLPFVHLVALTLGIASMKRGQRFIVKAAIACCLGGFFTILYALLTVGSFAARNTAQRLPDYSFLSAGKADTQAYVDLLNTGASRDVEMQLRANTAANLNPDWTFDTALALAEYQNHDLEGALKDFNSAFQKKPERSEFYFYYGLALLEDDNIEMAKEQFQQALVHEPKLEIAQQYSSLLQNLFKPDMISSAITYLLILFLLFTFHEYGHAFAAWKLGDDTAKNQGRLTLNPIAHLDLFGSIILPAILLFQQSDVFFGWAKPVPVDTRNFKHPNKDHMLVSFAGPMVNLLIAMVCMILLVLVALVTRLLWPETLSLNLVNPFSATSLVGPPFAKAILVFVIFLKDFFYTSLILGVFNLLPIPPLDGSWILAGVLPEKLRVIFDYIRRFGFMLFILLSVTHVMDYFLGIPIAIVWLGFRWVVSAMGFA